MSHNYSRTIDFDRHKFSDEFKRMHHNYERSVITLFQNALKEQVRPVIAFVKENGTEYLRTHLDALIVTTPIRNAYNKCYVRIGTQHAEFTYKWINKIAGKKDIGFFSAVWRRLMHHFYLTDSADRVTNVSDSTKDQIAKALDDADEQGLTTSETASYLVKTLQSDEFTRSRALTIARTESTAAANQGAMLAADSSDYLVGKIWIPVMDANTRPAHAEMDGEPAISLDGLFEVGGELLNYPGDLRGSAGNVINCRCCVAMVPLANEFGLPIFKIAA
jgi:hypothetical protein